MRLMYNKKTTQAGLYARRCFVLFAWLVMSCVFTQAQAASILVSGKIVNTNGEPILGAAVAEKGTGNGTVTDFEGLYSLSVEEGSTLVFQYMGYVSQEIAATSNTLNVTLQEETVSLDDLVVVAYGTQKKRDVIGSVATVDSEDLKAASGGNFQSALQGSAAGINVVTGMDGDSQIKIRGISSVSSGTDPLWIIDGMAGGQDDVNMNDIASIQILKDASATAIYGSRGSNGVIIVTTKRGQDGKASVKLNYQFGISQVINKDIGWANSEESLAILDTAYSNSLGIDEIDIQDVYISSLNYTSELTRELAEATDNDMLDVATRLGRFHDVNMSVTKGDDKASSYHSVTYRNEDFALEGYDKNTLTIRSNNDLSKGNTKFGIQANGKFTRTNDLSAYSSLMALKAFTPLYDATNPTGYWNPNMANAIGTDNYNPLSTMDPEYNRNQTTALSLRANFYIDHKFSFVDGLSFRADAGYNFALTKNDKWRSMSLMYDPALGNTGSAIRNDGWGQQYHAFFTYDKQFGDHNIHVITGTEIVNSTSYSTYLSGDNITGIYPELATVGSISSGSNSYLSAEGDTFSLFLSANYKFKDKYLLGGSFSREGSSKFSKENRYGNFFSVSAGWILSEEEWLKDVDWLSLLKLRGSIGETGNQNLPATATMTSIATVNTIANNWMGDTYSYYNTIGNSGLEWEKTQNIDFGIDFSMLNNRLSGSIAYYRQNISDMLLASQMPISSGLNSSKMWVNMGDMYNQGIEISAQYNVINNKNFKWKTNFNITTNKNVVTSLSDDVSNTNNSIIDDRYPSIVKEGYSVGTYYIAKWAGVDPETGVGMIYAIDQDVFAESGETVLTGDIIPATTVNIAANKYIQDGKSAVPTVYGSWSNTFNIKQFDLGFTLYYSAGNYIYNATRCLSTANPTFYGSWLTDSWKAPGDNAIYPELRWQDLYQVNSDGVWGATTSQSYNADTDFALEKADYLRLREVTVGYTLPESASGKIGLSNVRFYVSATNLFTLTGFSGYDPEFSYTTGTSISTSGMVYTTATRPQTAIYTFGVGLNF